ncbi:GspE/PulE family protein [Cerasicoccus maritimus]|uniref:GspE/PulE family protein n=1 Tax=Cerasicoccus maritimus TaxID=490089 RepID=UPI002852A4E7|nr:GspE/PulE family protein [Cerasicoccus maritimus]
MDDVPNSWLERLDEEQQEHFAEAPRQDRVKYLAGIWQEQEADVFARLAAETQTPVLDLIRLSEAPEDHLPLRLIHEYQCLPATVEEHGGELCLVTVWPPSPTMSDWVIAATGREPRWFIGDPSEVAELITQAYGVGSGSLEEQDMEGFADSEQNEEEEDEDAALIRFVNEVISKAIADRATDIHFEPQKETLNIRYRIDGVLVPVRVPENLKTFQRAIISRLKIMAKLNISERRRPQDGRIGFNYGNEELDIRISSLPTMYGESISLRLLSDKTQPVTIEDLGFMPNDVKMLDTILQRPHGIILATGPTGAGKSTTLSSFIRRIRDPRRRIVTIEDPVEYEIDGVNQTQVQSEIGLTFANSLRSVLRQDPDVIMVGEIRDGETADIAIRASLTGHLVLSSLHTNDAPGAITRLIDMDIEPFLIASSVELVIAQRLVRRICPHCSLPADIELKELSSCLMAMHIPASEITEAHLVQKPNGCERCRNLGFRGRVGLFEILRINDAIHELIIRRASAWEIRKLAEEQGMATLQRSGWEQVKRGITSLPEVMRYADVISEEEEKASADQPGTNAS